MFYLFLRRLFAYIGLQLAPDSSQIQPGKAAEKCLQIRKTTFRNRDIKWINVISFYRASCLTIIFYNRWQSKVCYLGKMLILTPNIYLCPKGGGHPYFADSSDIITSKPTKANLKPLALHRNVELLPLSAPLFSPGWHVMSVVMDPACLYVSRDHLEHVQLWLFAHHASNTAAVPGRL